MILALLAAVNIHYLLWNVEYLTGEDQVWIPDLVSVGLIDG